MTHGAATRFVGRERELDELRRALTDAEAGQGRVVLLGGEPGIGKSRLADELVSIARDRGHVVAWGRVWEAVGAPPYWPWVQVLRPLIRGGTDDSLRELLGPGARDVAQILPELRERIAEIPSSIEADSDSARFQLFDSTATFLRNVGERRPLVVVLDDMHAADLPSIRLLRFVAGQVAGAHLLLMATYRDLELVHRSAIAVELEEITREPTTRALRLTGLAVDDVRTLLLGESEDARGSAATGVATTLWRKTGGNPLFIAESVRLLSPDGRLGSIDDSTVRVVVPPGVREAISRRLADVDPATVELLRVGALLGPEFDLDLVRRLVGSGTEKAQDLADDAVGDGLIQIVPGALRRYRFAHELVRETLHVELPTAERARRHRQIGEVIEAMAGSADGRAPELAFHFGEALAGLAEVDAGDLVDLAGRALRYARLAGEQAAVALAYEEAATHYRFALRALELRGAAGDDQRVDLLLALGDVLGRAGDLSESRTAFFEAAELARTARDGRRLATAALGFPGRYPWARQGREKRVVPLLEDALALVGEGEPHLRVRLQARLACALRSAPERRAECDRLSQEAIDLARTLDDVATLNYAITGRYWATWWPENPESRVALAAEAERLADSIGDGERIIDARLMAFQSLVERGLLREATAAMDRLSDAIRDLRQPAQQWIEPANRTLLALIRGDLQPAERLIAEQHQIGPRLTPGQDHLIAARMHTYLLRREQGRAAETEHLIRASIADVPWYPFHRAALACLLLDAGRDSDAQEVLDALGENRFAALYRDNEWLLGMCLAAEAAARLGDVKACAELSEQLLPFAGRHAVGHAEGSVGAVDRVLGLLAAALGRLDAAVDHLEAAVAGNDAMDARSWAAHSRHELAATLRSRGDVGDEDRADRLDAEAKATAERLGMMLAMEIAGTAADGAATGQPARSVSTVMAASLRREGEYWTVRFGTDAFRLRDSKGLRHLARLLAEPGREIHVLELARAHGPDAPTPPANAAELDVPSGGGLGDAGAILDAAAKSAYRARLVEIREDIDEAERWNDPERVSRLRAEESALTHELAAALGLRGRDRVAASPSERARVSVSRAIRAALARIEEQSPGTGAHLNATVRTGTFCVYRPDPRAPINWRV